MAHVVVSAAAAADIAVVVPWVVAVTSGAYHGAVVNVGVGDSYLQLVPSVVVRCCNQPVVALSLEYTYCTLQILLAAVTE